VPADQSLRLGSLDDALRELKDEVRRNPADAKKRIFLFQLLAVTGDWGRALTQLDVLADLDPKALAMVQTYREALRCEALRAEVFAGRKSPVIFGDPPPWIARLVEAARLVAEGRYGASERLRQEAFEAADATPGSVDGAPFAWIADGDSRLGPVFEAIVAGRYYWVPVQNVTEVVLEEPADLRDLVWMPAYFTWANGGQSPALIPTRYPGSEASPDDPVRMARQTEWIEHEGDVVLGRGQRMLMTDRGEHALMDVRSIRLGAA